jgi:hypothetical protein
MRRRLAVVVTGLVIFSAAVSAAEDRAAVRGRTGSTAGSPSTRGRVLGTVIGAAGGFAIGLLVGLNKFDDAIDSDRKVWTTAVVAAAGGAIGGYFAGKALSPSTGTVVAPPNRTALPDPPAFNLRRAPGNPLMIQRSFRSLFAP